MTSICFMYQLSMINEVNLSCTGTAVVSHGSLLLKELTGADQLRIYRMSQSLSKLIEICCNHKI